MVSFRLPFSSFPPPPGPPNLPSSRRPSIIAVGAAAVAAACTAGVGLAITNNAGNQVAEFILSHLPVSSSTSLLASLSLSAGESSSSKTEACFPATIKESQTLLGVGLRRKRILGLKNIDVYAFGVYADEDDVQKHLKEKYGKLSASELKENKDFNDDLLASDINLTVRLQIIYSKLSIRSVRNAFEESVGNRLQKFGGPDNKQLLLSFTSQFRDELKLPKSSVIELSRGHGHVLHTTIDGEEVGSIQSKLLCQSLLDLYIGEDPFDQQAKDNVMLKLADGFEKKNSAV